MQAFMKKVMAQPVSAKYTALFPKSAGVGSEVASLKIREAERPVTAEPAPAPGKTANLPVRPAATSASTTASVNSQKTVKASAPAPSTTTKNSAATTATKPGAPAATKPAAPVATKPAAPVATKPAASVATKPAKPLQKSDKKDDKKPGK